MRRNILSALNSGRRQDEPSQRELELLQETRPMSWDGSSTPMDCCAHSTAPPPWPTRERRALNLTLSSGSTRMGRLCSGLGRLDLHIRLGRASPLGIGGGRTPLFTRWRDDTGDRGLAVGVLRAAARPLSGVGRVRFRRAARRVSFSDDAQFALSLRTQAKEARMPSFPRLFGRWSAFRGADR